jgi:hypothetical protein
MLIALTVDQENFGQKLCFFWVSRVPRHCNSEGAEIPFDNILDRVTGSDPNVTNYVLEQPAKCSELST